MLRVLQLKKSFRNEGRTLPVVDVPDFALGAGEQLGLRGRSGCGKTTFLHLLAGIHRADSGSICIGEVDMAALGESARDRLRAQKIGYVFQTFNLLQGYTVRENVSLAMGFAGHGVDRKRVEEILVRVGLRERLDYFPSQLSTGQQQRVAVARALVNRPGLVLADEPTGNLDPEHARDALALIREVCQESGAALLLVSHDPAVLAQFPRTIAFADVNRAAAAPQGGESP